MSCHAAATDLATLLVNVSRRPAPRWPTLTTPEAVDDAVSRALDSPATLRALARCYPEPTLRRRLFARFLGHSGVAPPRIAVLLERVKQAQQKVGPWPVESDWAEIADWAWERRDRLRF